MRRLSAKRVSVRTDASGVMATLAIFYLDGDELRAEWENEQYRTEVERDGIRALIHGEPGRVRLASGRAFYEALEAAYWQSSLMVVTPTEVERS